MSQARNLKWLDNKRVIYYRNPITDLPSESTDLYDYYAEGTYQCYSLFRSKAKITTYKSLKWHMLVLRYLNDNLLDIEFSSICHFLADKDNGFVTFFIKSKVLHKMIKEVLGVGDTPPKNRIRKVIFKPAAYHLTLSEKLSIVGALIGRSKMVTQDMIYDAMLSINEKQNKITYNKLANYFNCSTRTIYRNIGNQLKLEKELLNKEL